MTDVWLDGTCIGEVENAEAFIKQFKDLRRSNELPWQLSIRWDKDFDTIYIWSDPGRPLRPLIVVENGKSKLDEETLQLIKENKLSWNDLMQKGIIEYLDASEEDNCLVALDQSELKPEHTHLEIDPVAMFGTITSLVPYANHNQTARLNRGSKTQKQALGLYAANYPCLLDTDVSILHYPQKPLVRSFVYDSIKFYPAGQNMIVAIMTQQGYNMEDAIVMNKGSVDRGLARSTYFTPYTAIELHYTGNLKDEIRIPPKDAIGYKEESKYKHLEEDGICYAEARLSEKDVVIGKVSPPRFLGEVGEMSIAKAKKENSTTLKQEERGIADWIVITCDNEKNKLVHVRCRDLRIPELGDKFSTVHGQKGVIGLLVPEHEVPFTASGMKPDIIFNPHAIPSRMTLGYLLELLAGKVAALKAETVDATPFAGTPAEVLEQELIKLGFRPDGKETMYDPVTGKQFEAKIFIGCMYYLKLKYMVMNKMHARATGRVTLLTRQPVEGRAKGGALRLGEMEKDAIVAHGASLLLKERFSSDNTIIWICPECGSIGVKDRIRKTEYCPFCGEIALEPVEISYAAKLLFDELTSMHIYTKFKLKNKFE